MAWGSEAQLRLYLNTNEVTDLADDDDDASADTGVLAAALDRAAHVIWSLISDRYNDTTAMRPETYTAGDGTYPMLESQNCALARDYLRERQGGEVVENTHPVIQWAFRVRFFEAGVVAT